MRRAGLRGLTAVLVLSGLAALSDGARVMPAVAQSSSTVSAPAANPSAGDVDLLRERAATFWAARVAGDSKGQWELLEPRGRGRLTPGDYAVTRGAVKYIAYQVEETTVNGYFATVKVRLLVQPWLPTRQPKKIDPLSTLVSDRWVRIEGTWYRSLEQETTGPEASPQ
jgi:hypothetical protein